jgi:hypothetical protein
MTSGVSQKPSYTIEAMADKVQGTVDTVVLPDGSVGDVCVSRNRFKTISTHCLETDDRGSRISLAFYNLPAPPG